MSNLPESAQTTAYLETVQKAVDEYCRLTAGPTALTDFIGAKPYSKEAPHNADYRKAESTLRVHLIELHFRVFALWDAIASTSKDDDRLRLKTLADGCLDWIDEIGRCIENKYDTLSADNWPLESTDRERCHQRWEHEMVRVAEKGPWPVLCEQERPQTDFSRYPNPQLARVTYLSRRVIKDLYHWANEQVADDARRYYVYYPNPCQSRLDAFNLHMDNILTYWQHQKPELSRSLTQAYEALQRTCEKADWRFYRLSILPFWNEKDYGSPPEVLQAAATLHDALARITSLAEMDVEKPQLPTPEIRDDKKGGRPSLRKRNPKEAQRREGIALEWEQYHGAGPSYTKERFCKERHVTPKYLKKCLDWYAAQR